MKYYCETCSQQFVRQSTFDTHLKSKKHGNVLEKIKSGQNEQKISNDPSKTIKKLTKEKTILEQKNAELENSLKVSMEKISELTDNLHEANNNKTTTHNVFYMVENDREISRIQSLLKTEEGKQLLAARIQREYMQK